MKPSWAVGEYIWWCLRVRVGSFQARAFCSGRIWKNWGFFGPGRAGPGRAGTLNLKKHRAGPGRGFESEKTSGWARAGALIIKKRRAGLGPGRKIKKYFGPGRARPGRAGPGRFNIKPELPEIFRTNFKYQNFESQWDIIFDFASNKE